MPAIDELPEVLTISEVAAWLGVSPATVRRRAAEGEIPGVKLGVLWRFSRDRLRTWLAETSGPASIPQLPDGETPAGARLCGGCRRIVPAGAVHECSKPRLGERVA